MILVDGEDSQVIAVTDSSVLRGDGCFESIRSYGGRLFALGWHLERLERSAAMLGITPPPRSDLEAWSRRVAAVGDGVVRLLLTRGDAVAGQEARPRCVVMQTPLPEPLTAVRLGVVRAPWHPAGRAYELAGAKTLSYAPNLAATRSARTEGFDDALLVSEDDVVLEGPTFSVAWVVDGIVETPGLDLFVLDSITRRVMMMLAEHAGIRVVEVEAPLDRLGAATEVMAMSTVKEILPVTGVGDRGYPPGPVTARLASAFAEAVAAGVGD